MGKKNVDGLNSRFCDERFDGEQGDMGANISPQEIAVVIALPGAAGAYPTLSPPNQAPPTYPNGMVFTGAEIEVLTPFDNLATLIVGSAAVPNSLINLVDAVNLLTPGIKSVNAERTFTVAVPGPIPPEVPEAVIATISGFPTVGSARLTMHFIV